MEKLGVEVEKEKAKVAAEAATTCPRCDARLLPETNVPTCPSCGTLPFESEQ